MRRVVQRRLFVLSVPPGIPLDKLLERLSSALKASVARVRVRDGRVFIEVTGTKAQIRESWAEAKAVVEELWELYRLMRGGEGSVRVIVREVGRTFPPDALVEALRLRGYAASIEGDMLRTNAPYEVLIETARRIVEALDAVRFSAQGAGLRKTVAIVSAALGVGVEEVLERAVGEGLVERSGGKYRLLVDWRRALRGLAAVFKRG